MAWVTLDTDMSLLLHLPLVTPGEGPGPAGNGGGPQPCQSSRNCGEQRQLNLPWRVPRWILSLPLQLSQGGGGKLPGHPVWRQQPPAKVMIQMFPATPAPSGLSSCHHQAVTNPPTPGGWQGRDQKPRREEIRAGFLWEKRWSRARSNSPGRGIGCSRSQGQGRATVPVLLMVPPRCGAPNQSCPRI